MNLKVCGVFPGSLEELRSRLARELEVDAERLTDEARFVGDLGVSSINAIVVVMALEEWFNLQISDEEAEGLCTLQDVQAFLASRGTGPQAVAGSPV